MRTISSVIAGLASRCISAMCRELGRKLLRSLWERLVGILPWLEWDSVIENLLEGQLADEFIMLCN